MAGDNPRRDDSVGEEVSAFGERAKGAAKDAAGSITGNRRLEREGELENAEGRARQATNDVFDETDGVPGQTVRDTTTAPVRASGSMTEEAAATGERMKGAVKEATGSVLGLDRMMREGEVEKASGRARQDANDALGSATTSGYRTGTRIATWSPGCTTVRNTPVVRTTTSRTSTGTRPTTSASSCQMRLVRPISAT